MKDNETVWDERLHIKTEGRDDINSDEFRFPYEPTPYAVLQRLAESELILKGDTVLDYGCGKGRVGFYLSHTTKANCIGIEYDERIYRSAIENQKTALSKNRVSFVLTSAEEYEVPPEVNRCYFFNPFSVEILRRVMAKIEKSYYANPREILLFFYYPSDDYMCYLMTVDELEFYDEIDCDDLFSTQDPRERIMVFGFSDYEFEE
jgi:SAM-dependent methyltransferase